MKDAEVEALRSEFDERTGIDLADYAGSEVLEGVTLLASVPGEALQSLKRTCLVCLGLYLLGFVQMEGAGTVAGWAGGGGALMLLNAILLAVVVFIWRFKSRLSDAVGSTVGLVETVAVDMTEVAQRRQSGTLNFPSLGEINRAVTHVVIIPQVSTVLTQKIPLLGKLVRIPVVGVLRWWARREEKKSDELEAGYSEERPDVNGTGAEEIGKMAAMVGAVGGKLRLWSDRILGMLRVLALAVTIPFVLLALWGTWLVYRWLS